MTKRTWRFQSLRGEATAVMASAPSYRAAAKALGVNLSTVVRWRQQGKVPAPGGRRGAAAGPPPSPEGWAASVRSAYDLNATELELVGLAEAALALARDAQQPPAIRLNASSRYQSLVRQLDLEVSPDGEVETPAPRRPWPRPVLK